MEKHLIISQNTLLSKGLYQFLKSTIKVNVDLVSLDDLKNQESKILQNVQFIWIDVIQEIQNLIKLSKKLIKTQPDLKVFAFGEFKDLKSIKSILNSGISGYFLSNCCTENIKEAILHADDHKPYIDPKMAEIYFEKLIQSQPTNSSPNRITKREKQILQLIVEEYTTHEIANKLFISSCTVETHRLHLIQKMGVRNTAGLVREAMSANLVD